MKRPRAKSPLALPPPERRVVLGIVGAPHGVRGECRLKSFTGDPMAIADYGPLFAADGRAFAIEDGRFLKDDLLVVKFAGIADRDAVKALTGTELFVDRQSLPEPEDDEEFYHADLIGLALVDAQGIVIGEVTGVQNFGAGDILELRPAEGGANWMLPFTKDAAPRIELAARRITIDPAFLMKPEPAAAKPDDEPGDLP